MQNYKYVKYLITVHGSKFSIKWWVRPPTQAITGSSSVTLVLRPSRIRIDQHCPDKNLHCYCWHNDLILTILTKFLPPKNVIEISFINVKSIWIHVDLIVHFGRVRSGFIIQSFGYFQTIRFVIQPIRFVLQPTCSNVMLSSAKWCVVLPVRCYYAVRCRLRVDGTVK